MSDRCNTCGQLLHATEYDARDDRIRELETHLELKDDRIVIQSNRNVELEARHQLLIDLVTKHEPSLRVLFEAISKEDKHE